MPDRSKGICGKYNVTQLRERYGESAGGNFRVVDTISVPHPYMIGPRHVEHAADKFLGRLGEEAIRSAEAAGHGCLWKGCRLSYAEHDTALLVSCAAEVSGEGGVVVPELHEYLLRCKPLAEADGFAGFAFRKA